MDVTQEILKKVQEYGVTSNTNPGSLASSHSLNYAKGTSIDKPIVQNVTAFPVKLKYADKVGLFGSENVFIKFQLNITEAISSIESIEEPDGYLTLLSSRFTLEGETGDYESAVETWGGKGMDPNYENAKFISAITNPATTRVSVNLTNLKTGNKFLDNWFDVVIYNKNRKPHAYDLMYLKPNDFCYIGLHARAPKRIPFNIEVDIGQEYLSVFNLTEEQRRYEG